MLHASGLRHIHGNATDHGSIYPALRLRTHFTGIGSITLLSRTLTTDAAQLEIFQLNSDFSPFDFHSSANSKAIDHWLALEDKYSSCHHAIRMKSAKHTSNK